MLTQSAIEEYLKEVTPQQSSAITSMRELIFVHAPELVEKIDNGKWFGGLLTYYLGSGQFVFALGPRSNGFTTFHMMPFYASKDLQEAHNLELKKFLSGKSCIKFKTYSDLPEESIIDIIKNSKIAEMFPAQIKASA